MLSFLIFLFAAAPAGAPLPPQQLRAEIPLAGIGDPLATGKSFGLALEPASGLLYVAVCGDLPFVGTPNRAIAVVDPLAAAVIGWIPVGAFPEEIAFAHDPVSGALRYGACTNSQDGSVTIWDASRQPVATIPLPDPLGFGTCFPFGIVVNDSHFLITTQDGSGDVHAISLTTLTLDPGASRQVGANRLGARCAVRGAELWIADSLALPGFSGAEGGWRALDWSSGATRGWMTARDDSFTLYPAGQDLALLPDGGAWLGGTDLGGRLWRVDASGALRRALEVGGRNVYGLAADATGGLLAATTLYGGELLLVDALAERLVSATGLATLGVGHAQPNDALFVGDRLFVTCQGSEFLLAFDALPAPGPAPDWVDALSLTSGAPAGGARVSATLAAPGQAECWLLGAGECAEVAHGGLDLRLGAAPRLHASGRGTLTRSILTPAASAARGRAWFLQGVVTGAGGQLHATAPAAVVVQ